MKVQDEGRSSVRELLTPSTAQSALQRILPFPCKKQYTVVILMPRRSLVKLLTSLFQFTNKSHSRQAMVSQHSEFFLRSMMHVVGISELGQANCSPKFSKPNGLIFLMLQILAGVAGLTVFALTLWRYSRRTLRS